MTPALRAKLIAWAERLATLPYLTAIDDVARRVAREMRAAVEEEATPAGPLMVHTVSPQGGLPLEEARPVRAAEHAGGQGASPSAPTPEIMSFPQAVGVPSLSSVRKAIRGTPAPELWGVWCELEDDHGEWWPFEGRRLEWPESVARDVARELRSRNWTFSARPIPKEER
jgi:hypothetical protein